MTMNSPKVLGLTGSIGMGKSTVAAMFADEGVPVFDADATVREMQAPGGALLAPIEAAFPRSTGPEGVLREKLGAIVFKDEAKLKQLEGIVHPAVAAARIDFLTRNSAQPMVLFDIPLLFENGGHHDVDTIIVVSAPADVQRERVLARPGASAEKFENILKLQVPDAEKREQADYVIDTGTSLEETRAAVKTLVAELRAALDVSNTSA